MTLAELIRAIDSKKRIQLQEAKEKAAYDYILADLIGRSISRIYNSSNTMPSLANAYPSLYSAEEEEENAQAKKDELSALRFRQFAQSFNQNFKKEVGNKDE